MQWRYYRYEAGDKSSFLFTRQHLMAKHMPELTGGMRIFFIRPPQRVHLSTTGLENPVHYIRQFLFYSPQILSPAFGISVFLSGTLTSSLEAGI